MKYSLTSLYINEKRTTYITENYEKDESYDENLMLKFDEDG